MFTISEVGEACIEGFKKIISNPALENILKRVKILYRRFLLIYPDQPIMLTNFLNLPSLPNRSAFTC